ncbi:hypothetical protein C8R44DRAFT_889520 [Mycena epipterygia]|nr:hypothetical protein C8R44DRAFT_889520 [Mycena epipterygia]
MSETFCRIYTLGGYLPVKSMDPAHRDMVLNAIRQLEHDTSQLEPQITKCPDCADLRGAYRCLHCFSHPFLCPKCIVKRHAENPLHRIEMWTGTALVGTNLKSLGLRIQLSHSAEDFCFEPMQDNDFIMLNAHGDMMDSPTVRSEHDLAGHGASPESPHLLPVAPEWDPTQWNAAMDTLLSNYQKRGDTVEDTADVSMDLGYVDEADECEQGIIYCDRTNAEEAQRNWEFVQRCLGDPHWCLKALEAGRPWNSYQINAYKAERAWYESGPLPCVAQEMSAGKRGVSIDVPSLRFKHKIKLFESFDEDDAFLWVEDDVKVFPDTEID